MEYLRRYPFVVPLLCLGLGIWLAEQLQWKFKTYYLLATLIWLIAWSRQASPGWLSLLLILTGAARWQFAVTPWSPADLRNQLLPAATLLAVRGELLETPLVRTYEHSGRPRSHTRAILELSALRLEAGDWRPAHGRIQATLFGELPSTYFGARLVEATGVIAPPSAALTPGAFDNRTYLRRQNIHFELRTADLADWQLLDETAPPPRPLADRFQSWGRQVLGLGFTGPDAAIDLLCAMALGWKPGLDASTSDPFMKSGTMHIFAISGLHIALIALIWVECLRLIGVSRAATGLIVMPLIWAYTGLTGWQPSAIRSAVMMSVVAGTWLLKRPANVLNNLAGAAVVLLIWDPEQLFQPGFQLSFCVVGHLGLFATWITRGLEEYSLEDPHLPGRLQPAWRKRGQAWLRSLRPHVAASLVAWIGSAPLIAHYFHLFSPISLLANLLVVPLSSLALASCVGSLVCGALWPSLAELFNHSSWLLMHLMLRLSTAAAEVPCGWFYVPGPGVLGFLSYVVGVLLAIHSLRGPPPPRWRWGWGLLGVLLLGAAVEHIWDGWTCRITLLPRRGGVTAWVDEGWGRQKWLIDPGDPQECQRVTLPFLQTIGVNQIPNLVASHASQVQAGGAEWLEEHFGIYRRFAPLGAFRSSSFRRWQEEARHQARHLHLCERFQTIGNWEVLSPARRVKAVVADEGGLVLRGSLSGLRVLWLPKLNLAAQDALLRDPELRPRLQADLLIAALSSQGQPPCEALIGQVMPQILILADAATPASSRTPDALRESLKGTAHHVFFASSLPAIQLQVRRGSVEVIAGEEHFTVRYQPRSEPSAEGGLPNNTNRETTP